MQQLTLFEIPKPVDVPADILVRYGIKVNQKKDTETVFIETMTAIRPLEKRYLETRAGDWLKDGEPPVIEDIDAFLFYAVNLDHYKTKAANPGRHDGF